MAQHRYTKRKISACLGRSSIQFGTFGHVICLRNAS